MKRRKKTKTTSNLPQTPEIKYIPLELWTQIFAILPVKTLVRFRCVCKSWCSIIDDPDFVSMHFKLCKINSNNNKLLLTLERLGRHGYKGCLLTVRQDTLRKTAHIYKSCENYFILRRCNGLLLILRYAHRFDLPGLREELRLWNPSIRKTLLIPPCPLPPSWYGKFQYVLGFAPCINDYKVVGISFEKNGGMEPTKISVAVYTLSDRQWTVRNNGLNISCGYFRDTFGLYKFPSTELFFQGATYWLGKVPYGDRKPTHLVSLDFDMEKLNFLELPYALDEINNFWFMFLLGESLAIFNISSVNANIWVLEQESGNGVWTLWFSGHSSSNGFNLFTSRMNSPVFYYEGDDGGCLICGKNSYNIASCQVQELGKSMRRLVDLETYTESLVLCKGYGAEDMTSFP